MNFNFFHPSLFHIYFIAFQSQFLVYFFLLFLRYNAPYILLRITDWAVSSLLQYDLSFHWKFHFLQTEDFSLIRLYIFPAFSKDRCTHTYSFHKQGVRVALVRLWSPEESPSACWRQVNVCGQPISEVSETFGWLHLVLLKQILHLSWAQVLVSSTWCGQARKRTYKSVHHNQDFCWLQ